MQQVFGADNHYIQDEGRGCEILEVVVLTEHCYFILSLTPTHMHRHSQSGRLLIADVRISHISFS